ncbi:hypothetical protein AZE42_10468 [Rhizopogon vesiculosus]|uniref:CLASP N-terminal domain-containing protein n=1 Tax=Rhizopogon vesiculosus TaxID=180088 RepID=A0A1J8PMT1_9AGAM|nr:hypothetical protein AZE42_10468 [Rhizopogon vesiculosus]
MPNLLGLYAQTNKVLTSRAKACIVAVIKHTQSPSILPYIAESLHLKSGSPGFLSDGVENFIAPFITLEKRIEVQGTASSRSAFRPTTGRTKPTGSTALQGAFRVSSQPGNSGMAAPRATSQAHRRSRPTSGRVPSEPGPSSTQSTNRRRDIARPTQLPRWVGKMFTRSDPLLVTDGAEMPRTIQKTRIPIATSQVGFSWILSDGVESFIAPFITLEKRIEVQGTASSRSALRPTTGRTRSIRSTALQGALRVSSQPGSSSLQSTTQRRDITRPVVLTTQRPQRAGNSGMAAPRATLHAHHRSRPTDIARPTQLPRWVGKMFTRPDPLPVTNGTEMPRTIQKTRIPSAKPSSVGSLPKPVISQSDPKNNPVVRSANSTSTTAVKPPSRTRPVPFTKSNNPVVRSANSTSTTAVKPSSRTRPVPFTKSVHPATRSTSSRIARPRAPTKLQTAPS